MVEDRCVDEAGELAARCRTISSASLRMRGEQRIGNGSREPASILALGHTVLRRHGTLPRVAHLADASDRRALPAGPSSIDAPAPSLRRPRHVLRAAPPGSPAPPSLKTLSPTARLWSRPGMSSACAPRHERGKRVRVAGDVVLGADRDQRRAGDRADLVAASGSAASRGCRRRAPEVGAWSLGEGAEHALGADRSRLVERRRFHGVGDALAAGRRPRPGGCRARRGSTERTPLGRRRRQERGDARAHRIAHDVGPRDAEMVEQRARRRPPCCAVDRRRGS